MPSIFADGLFWLSVACCAIAQFYIIRSVRGTRHVPEPASDVPRAHDSVEMLWAVLPAFGLIALLLFTWRAIHPAGSIVIPDSSIAAPAASL